jgi:hypothetical protein
VPSLNLSDLASLPGEKEREWQGEIKKEGDEVR